MEKMRAVQGDAERGGEVDEMKWVYDSSVDHKGRIPSRASTGSWKASFFIIAIEFSEKLSYFGIATSLVLYLTKVIGEDLKTAARNVNYWSGVTTLMPLFGGFLADAYLGRYFTVFTSCIIYLLGLVLLSMSWFVPGLKPCDTTTCTEPRRVHEVVFFLAIYLISMATGGHKPSLESFGADQFDDDHTGERRQKMSFFNWWNCGLCSGLILGVTLIVYVQDHVNWGAADVILTVVMGLSLVIFVMGRPFYRFRAPSGSPLTPMLQVLVAAFHKRKLPDPTNPSQFYEVSKSEINRGRLLCQTKQLKFLDRAAIMVDQNDKNSGEKQSPWKLATVTKVEETKLMINMIPIWIFTLPFGIVVAQTSTFFIKQATTLNRHIVLPNNRHFQIPPASLYALSAVGMILAVALYDRLLVPLLRKLTGNERGITILQRIGFGMLFSVSTMIIAALVESMRLNRTNTTVTMSVFWLAPQFLVVGFGDGFTLVGLQEYFYDQVPDSMRSVGIGLYLSVIGAANFLSSVVITVVDHVTERGGGKSWFGRDLNSSRLDLFYWLLAVITALNLFGFVFFARRYSYKNVQKVAVADCYEGEGEGKSEDR